MTKKQLDYVNDYLDYSDLLLRKSGGKLIVSGTTYDDQVLTEKELLALAVYDTVERRKMNEMWGV